MGKMRPLKLETLWVVPVIYLAVAALMFFATAADGLGRHRLVVGLLIGAAVGWQRGKMMHIHVDPETHALNQKASPTAMFFLIALIAGEDAGARLAWAESGVSPAMLTDPLIAFALGMFTLHARRNVSPRQAPARGGARRRCMTDERRFYEGSRGRCSAARLPRRSAIGSRSLTSCANGFRRAASSSKSPAAPVSMPSISPNGFPRSTGSRATSIRTRSRRSPHGVRRPACRTSAPPVVIDAGSADWPIERADAVLSINMQSDSCVSRKPQKTAVSTPFSISIWSTSRLGRQR